MRIRNLGTYSDFNSLWEAHPEGGHEGDYVTVGSTEYSWNKYRRVWGVSDNPEQEVIPYDNPGLTLTEVWDSLVGNVARPDLKINLAHIPDIPADRISGLEDWLTENGYSRTPDDSPTPVSPGGGSTVSITQHIDSGTPIATLTIDGRPTTLFAPSGGGGTSEGGSEVSILQQLDSGIPIATITIDGAPTSLFAPAWFIDEQYENNGETRHRLKLNPAYDGLYALGWIASGGIGSGSGGSGGGSYSPGDGIDITNDVISLQPASTNALGGVKVGTGLTIDANGVLSATGGGGGGGISSIKVGTAQPVTADSNGMATITNPVLSILPGWFSEYFSLTPGSLSSGVVVATVQIGNGSPFNLYAPSGGGGGGSTVAWGNPGIGTVPLTVNGSTYTLLTSHQDLSNYVTLDGIQSITGAKTFTTPVTVNASVGDSYIDIGNARLVYDSGTNALHITKKSGTQAVGLYADGFVASGAVGGQTTSSYVDLESDQEIGGNKTLTGDLSVEGNAYFDSGMTMSGDLDIDGVVISTGTVNGATGLTVAKNAKFSWTEGGSSKSVTIKELLDRIIALGG